MPTCRGAKTRRASRKSWRLIYCSALVSLLLLSILASGLIKFTKATESDNLWYTTWGNFQDYSDAPETVSTTTTVSDVTGIYQYKVALVVSVYQYQSFYDCDSVNFRVAVYIESSSTELPAYAWQVMTVIEKDTSGSNLNRQTMETVYSGVRPGFSQSYGLSQTTSTSSTYDDRASWALKALAFAAGLFYQPIGVVTGLINIATAFLPAGGVDYQDAGKEDPEALIWWNDGFGGLDENKQYCLNSVQWMQDANANPSTYYGLKIWARVALAPQLVPGLPPDIDTPPVYLRIYHNDPPATPSTPSGPTSGYVGTLYSYSTSTTDPDGDDVQFVFDWGDGTTTTTGWYSGEAYSLVTHSWSSVGTYTVEVKAYDPSGLWSESQPLTVNIVYSTWTCNYCGATFSYEPSYCPYCCNSYTKVYVLFCINCGFWFHSPYPPEYYQFWCSACRSYSLRCYAIWYRCNYCGRYYSQWNGCYHSSFTPS